MPTISVFYGITIRMYFGDHNPPHFHAEYAGVDAEIAITDGRFIRGALPRAAARLVEAWRSAHLSELEQNWRLAVGFQSPNRIEGLE